MARRHSRTPRPSDALVTQVAAWTSICGPGASASSALWLCGSLWLPSLEGSGPMLGTMSTCNISPRRDASEQHLGLLLLVHSS